MRPWLIRLVRFGTFPTYLFCFPTNHSPNYCFLNSLCSPRVEGCSEELLLICPGMLSILGFRTLRSLLVTGAGGSAGNNVCWSLRVSPDGKNLDIIGTDTERT